MSDNNFNNHLNTNIQLVDRKTAAGILGVKENTLTLWAMRKKNNLPYIKVGRLVRYRLSDLETFLERNCKSDQNR